MNAVANAIALRETSTLWKMQSSSSIFAYFHLPLPFSRPTRNNFAIGETVWYALRHYACLAKLALASRVAVLREWSEHVGSNCLYVCCVGRDDAWAER
jgi:hypothetical protein